MAESSLERPEPLTFDGNRKAKWNTFLENYRICINAAYSNNSNASKASYLLNWAGQEARNRAKAFVYNSEVRVNDQVVTPAEDKNAPEVLIRKFTELCDPHVNMTIERHNFNTRSQLKKGQVDPETERVMKEDEDIYQFIGKARILASTCEFGALADDLIRDRIVCGVINPKLRELFFKEDRLTLDKLLKIVNVFEQSRINSKRVQKDKAAESASVDELRRSRRSKPPSKPKHKTEVPKPKTEAPTATKEKCDKCSYIHRSDYCPAKGQQCTRCGGWNHFKKCCKSTGKVFQGAYKKKGHRINELDDDEEGDSDDWYEGDYTISEIEVDSVRSEIFATLDINEKSIEAKIDTGARCNVMSLENFKKLQKNEVIDQSKTINLIAFGGNRVVTKGSTTFKCKIDEKHHNVQFHIVDKSVKTLLGLKDIVKLQLMQFSEAVHAVEEELLQEYNDVFDDTIEKLPVTYQIKLNPDVKPVVMPPRQLPIAIQDRVKKELDDMERKEIIAKVERPTEWVSAVVAAKKKDRDEIRICIDPQNLNKAIIVPHHPMKTIEQVVAAIPGAKYFTALDAKTSFWQIKLEEESSYYTTFQTPFGRYRFLRMPYGITAGSEVYQRAMEHLFEGYPCQIVVDDILVCGKTEEEHDENLKKVLDRAREVNLRLNKKKCKICVSSVGYVGHLLTSDGLKPDPMKTAAICEMPKPEDKQGVQRFLGFINYLGKFIENLSEKAKPLRDLIKKENDFVWGPEQDKSFQVLKQSLVEKPLLGYYDVSKKVRLTCDASQSGLGAAILQDGRPIASASKAMTETQMNYAQIEKELLAVLFACKKFDQYIYGKSVIVETDHQPLVTIFNKPLRSAPMRLQKMMLSLQRYNITLTYRKGKEMYVADTLSRAYIQDDLNMEEDEYEVMTVSPVSTSRMDVIKEKTEQDPILQRLIKVIINGWPRSENNVHSDIRPFFKVRDELTVNEGVVRRGTRVVIPQSLQEEYVKVIHMGHPGAESTKRRARETIYWPNIASDINKMAAACNICNSTKKHLQKDDLKMYDVPELPWQIIASDVFEWQHQQYLLVVDSYSGWYENSAIV